MNTLQDVKEWLCYRYPNKDIIVDAVVENISGNQIYAGKNSYFFGKFWVSSNFSGSIFTEPYTVGEETHYRPIGYSRNITSNIFKWHFPEGNQSIAVKSSEEIPHMIFTKELSYNGFFIGYKLTLI